MSSVDSQLSSSGVDPQAHAAVVALLRSDRTPKVMVLAGLPGSGRRRLLEAVAEAAGGVKVLDLDLDGFEPVGPGLPAFLEFLLAFERAIAEDVQAQLRQIWQPIVSDPAAADSGKWAIVMALTLRLAEPAAALTAALGVGARPSPEGVLQACLAAQSSVTQWLVHVPEHVTLAEPIGQWLVRVCTGAGNGALALAFSCAPPIASDALVGVRRGWCTPLRIEFSPAPLQPSAAGVELRTRLESIFAECGEDAARLRRFLELAVVCGEVAPSLPLMAAVGFSQVDAERCVDLIDDHLCGHDDALALFEDLAYRHPGFPGLSVYRFANAQTRALVREQIEPAVLANAAQELWTFLSTRLGVATRSVAQLFANLALPAQPDRAAGPLQRLRLWVGGGEVEALQDLLADDVRAGRLPAEALFSAAQRDASMPAHQRLALLEAASVEIAVECGAASARADGSAPRSDGPAGPASAVATSDGAEASAGASTPRENAVEQVAGGGAALDVNGASADGGGSLRDRASVAAGGGGASTDRNAPAAIDRALATAVLRTELLCALGKFGPALESADAAQRLLATQPSEPPGVKGLLLFLTANCRRRLGQLDQALAAFRAAADEASRPRPDGSVDHHNIGVCLAESGHCHAERAEWPEAIRLLDEALNLLKQSDPDNQLHREQVAQLERNLAVCQTKLAEAHAH